MSIKKNIISQMTNNGINFSKEGYKTVTFYKVKSEISPSGWLFNVDIDGEVKSKGFNYAAEEMYFKMMVKYYMGW